MGSGLGISVKNLKFIENGNDMIRSDDKTLENEVCINN